MIAIRSLHCKCLMSKHKLHPKRCQSGRLLPLFVISVLILAISGAIAVWLTVRHFARDLPSVVDIRSVELGEPMRIYTRDGALIAEYGTERRSSVRYEEIPDRVINAFIAAEDERFFDHGGVDPIGLLRAAIRLVQSGERAEGGSTITMQLARNVFLTRERTYTRKIREILLAFQIEQELSKGEILELYLNKIFLGERAYGVAAAALVYFSAPLDELTIEQAALLAGLPKAPSRDNPIANPQRALERRAYVLNRMLSAGFISRFEHDAAQAAPLGVKPYRLAVETEALYAAEMARQTVIDALGESAYSKGYRVVTTLIAEEQAAAVRAVRAGLLDVEERQGWRGPEATLDADVMADPEALLRALGNMAPSPELTVAAVTGVKGEDLQLLTADGVSVLLPPKAWAWAGKDRDWPPGTVVRLRANGDGWRLAQIPERQGAYVGLDPATGHITAMVGGYDFYDSSFNRAFQAERQVGSSFKPFLYAAAMDMGFSPASVLLDAPVVFDDPNLEEAWRPTNYSGRFYGPTRLREALVHSRNLVTVRLLQALGFDPVREYVARFGLAADRLPRDLTMALGSAAFTPLEVAQAYAVFASGGYRHEPQLVLRVEATDGQTVWPEAPDAAATPPEAVSDTLPEDAERDEGARVIPEAVAWLVTDILRDATRRGTAAALGRALDRNDLAGKTGTTNDETDAWFAGYSPDRVGVAWVGYDQPQRIGRGEVGGRAALPIWIDVMRAVTRDLPDRGWPQPEGVMSVRIDPDTGRRTDSGSGNAVWEYMRTEDREGAGTASADTPVERRPPQPQRDVPALDDLF
jgi:penicillin-binding protein 1A